jgi:hypothetical protein
MTISEAKSSLLHADENPHEIFFPSPGDHKPREVPKPTHYPRRQALHLLKHCARIGFSHGFGPKLSGLSHG